MRPVPVHPPALPLEILLVLLSSSNPTFAQLSTGPTVNTGANTSPGQRPAFQGGVRGVAGEKTRGVVRTALEK